MWNYILIQRLFYAPKDIAPLGNLGTICFYITNFLDIPITFALIGLSGNILVQLYENQTTLENFERGVLHQRRYPVIGVPKNQKNLLPNKYDILWSENMKQVLGPSIILWPLPFYTPEMKGWGFYYPHIPDIN